MGRHRSTGLPRPQQAALLATGAVTSHRRARSTAWARSASVLALGVLAAGAVITATHGSWFRQDALPPSRTNEPAVPPGGGPAAAPGPGRPAPGPAATTTPAAFAGAPAEPAPTEPAPTEPAPTEPAAAAVRADLWSADTSGFRTTPWSAVGAVPPRLEGGELSVQLTGRDRRSEVEPDVPAVREGDRHDLTFALWLDRDFPLHAPGRQVIARWENDGPGPAPLDLRVRDGQLVLHGGEGHPGGSRAFDRPLGAVPTGQWVQVGVRVHFSANPATGHVSVMRDEQPVLTEHHPPAGTLYPGQQSNLTLGLHRDAAVAQPAAVHFRDLRIARTRAASGPEHRSVASPSTARHSSIRSATPSHAASIPRQRSASSSEHASSGHASSGHASSGHASSGHASSGHVSTEHASSGRASSGHPSTGHASTEHGSAAQGHSHSSGPTSHGAVPRNTPSHVSTSHGRSTARR